MNVNHFPAFDLQKSKACFEQKQTAKLVVLTMIYGTRVLVKSSLLQLVKHAYL